MIWFLLGVVFTIFFYEFGKYLSRKHLVEKCSLAERKFLDSLNARFYRNKKLEDRVIRNIRERYIDLCKAK